MQHRDKKQKLEKDLRFHFLDFIPIKGYLNLCERISGKKYEKDLNNPGPIINYLVNAELDVISKKQSWKLDVLVLYNTFVAVGGMYLVSELTKKR